jgi:hypothetical protein
MISWGSACWQTGIAVAIARIAMSTDTLNAEVGGELVSALGVLLMLLVLPLTLPLTLPLALLGAWG